MKTRAFFDAITRAQPNTLRVHLTFIWDLLLLRNFGKQQIEYTHKRLLTMWSHPQMSTKNVRIKSKKYFNLTSPNRFVGFCMRSVKTVFHQILCSQIENYWCLYGYHTVFAEKRFWQSGRENRFVGIVQSGEHFAHLMWFLFPYCSLPDKPNLQFLMKKQVLVSFHANPIKRGAFIRIKNSHYLPLTKSWQCLDQFQF